MRTVLVTLLSFCVLPLMVSCGGHVPLLHRDAAPQQQKDMVPRTVSTYSADSWQMYGQNPQGHRKSSVVVSAGDFHIAWQSNPFRRPFSGCPVADADGHVYIFDAYGAVTKYGSDGAPLWSTYRGASLTNESTLAVGNGGHVYAYQEAEPNEQNGSMTAYVASTGSVAWTYGDEQHPFPMDAGLASPLVAEMQLGGQQKEVVLFAATNSDGSTGTLYVFSDDANHLYRSISINKAILGSPAVVGENSSLVYLAVKIDSTMATLREYDLNQPSGQEQIHYAPAGFMWRCFPPGIKLDVHLVSPVVTDSGDVIMAGLWQLCLYSADLQTRTLRMSLPSDAVPAGPVALVGASKDNMLICLNKPGAAWCASILPISAGDPVWTVTSQGAGSDAALIGPGAVDGENNVYLATDHELIAFAYLGSGWDTQPSSPITEVQDQLVNPPVIGKYLGSVGHLYVGSMQGTLYAVGEPLVQAAMAPWPMHGCNSAQQHSTPLLGPSVPGPVVHGFSVGGVNERYYAEPVIGRDGTVYLVGHTGCLHAVSQLGTESWHSAETGSGDHNYASAALGPLDRLYLYRDDGYLYAYNITPGLPGTVRSSIWSIQIPGTHSETHACPLVDSNGDVIVTLYDPNQGVAYVMFRVTDKGNEAECEGLVRAGWFGGGQIPATPAIIDVQGLSCIFFVSRHHVASDPNDSNAALHVVANGEWISDYEPLQGYTDSEPVATSAGDVYVANSHHLYKFLFDPEQSELTLEWHRSPGYWYRPPGFPPILQGYYLSGVEYDPANQRIHVRSTTLIFYEDPETGLYSCPWYAEGYAPDGTRIWSNGMFFRLLGRSTIDGDGFRFTQYGGDIRVFFPPQTDTWKVYLAGGYASLMSNPVIDQYRNLWVVADTGTAHTLYKIVGPQ